MFVPHAFDVVILTVIGEDPINNVVFLVPCPEIICHPSETTHVYEIAPDTAGTVKLACEPMQAGLGPDIWIGAPGLPIEYLKFSEELIVTSQSDVDILARVTFVLSVIEIVWLLVVPLFTI